jgi:hypothetical protein
MISLNIRQVDGRKTHWQRMALSDLFADTTTQVGSDGKSVGAICTANSLNTRTAREM